MRWLPHHRSHDYPHLISRWQQVAGLAGLDMRVIAKPGGTEVFLIESPSAQAGGGAAYLSAGVHGDEPAAVCGLLAWAEKNIALLKRRPFIIFPILNPRGLMLNTRTDHRGLDLNRRFHLRDDEVCGPWRQALSGRRLSAALCLHEDYDALGCYVYELSRCREPVSHSILRACGRKVTLDPRANIEGRIAKDGVIRRRNPPTDLPGMPEAIELHLLGCPVGITFETPSEFSLDFRIAAQERFITEALKRLAP